MRFALITLLIALLTAVVIAIVMVPPEDLREFQNRLAVTVDRIRDRIGNATDASQQRIQTSASDRSLREARLDERAARERRPDTRPPGQPIGAWTYRCDLDQPASARQCSISQTITDSSDGAVAFSWTISSDPEGNLSSVWHTRTGVKVNRGIVLEAGTPKPVVIPYEDCTAQYCSSRANLAADFVATLSKVTAARAAYRNRFAMTLRQEISKCSTLPVLW